MLDPLSYRDGGKGHNTLGSHDTCPALLGLHCVDIQKGGETLSLEINDSSIWPCYSVSLSIGLNPVTNSRCFLCLMLVTVLIIAFFRI